MLNIKYALCIFSSFFLLTICQPTPVQSSGLQSTNPADLQKRILFANKNKTRVTINQNIDINHYLITMPVKGFSGNGTITSNKAIIYKQGLDFIGIPENLNQQKYIFPNLIHEGNIIAPPKALNTSNRAIDLLAYWYNDFGLKSTALAKGNGNGDYSWYDWSWNFTNKQTYDPSRHPLLGWYHGDNVNVLDWQCYWLNKYGIKGVILPNVIDQDNFKTEINKMYWTNVLFNKVKNFKSLSYVLAFDIDKSHGINGCNTQQNFIIDKIIATHKNAYAYKLNGKSYLAFFVWDMEAMRGLYDNYINSANTCKRLLEIGIKVKKLGYDGVAIMGRNFALNEQTYPQSVVNDLEKKGVYIFNCDYSGTNDQAFSFYSDYARDFKFLNTPRSIVNIMTSCQSLAHPSNFSIKNSTPKAFENLTRRAFNFVNHNKVPKIITIYNVSEWAEGGPGLQPNQRDGFGYLNSIVAATK